MEKFVVGGRYNSIKYLWSDILGTTTKALDRKSGEHVAVKQFYKIESSLFAKNELRELRILRHLKHDNLAKLVDVLFDEKDTDIGNIYLVTKLMDYDLYTVIKNHHLLTGDHVKFLTYQIVRILLYLHSADIVHGCLEPLNILVNVRCDVQLYNFRHLQVGMSVNHQGMRYYLAPELLITLKYTTASDIWSLGCIMAELITGKILFKNHDHVQQLILIFETLGKPKDLSFISSSEAKKYIEKLPDESIKPLSSIIDFEDKNALDILQKMLEIDPNKRITASEAITHPYFSELYEPCDEPICKVKPDFLFLGKDRDSFKEVWFQS